MSILLMMTLSVITIPEIGFCSDPVIIPKNNLKLKAPPCQFNKGYPKLVQKKTEIKATLYVYGMIKPPEGWVPKACTLRVSPSKGGEEIHKNLDLASGQWGRLMNIKKDGKETSLVRPTTIELPTGKWNVDVKVMCIQMDKDGKAMTDESGKIKKQVWTTDTRIMIVK